MDNIPLCAPVDHKSVLQSGEPIVDNLRQVAALGQYSSEAPHLEDGIDNNAGRNGGEGGSPRVWVQPCVDVGQCICDKEPPVVKD